MNHNKFSLQRLSVKDETRALKVLLSAIIGIYLCNLTNYFKISTTVITVGIVFAMLPTVSGARTYCIQRFFANILGAILTFCIGIIFSWNIYSLALICSLDVFIFYKFNLNKTKLSLMSLVSGSLILFFTMSDPSQILVRLSSILLGSLIAITINELILPINQGFKVEELIFNFSKEAFKITDYMLLNISSLDVLNIKNLSLYNQAIKPNLLTLDKEAKINSLKNHLKHYKYKINTLDYLGIVCESYYDFLSLVSKNLGEFNNLSIEEKLYIKELLSNFTIQHKYLLDNVLNNNHIQVFELLDIDHSKFELNNSLSVLLLGRVLEYRESLIKLKESIDSINLNNTYQSVEFFKFNM